MGYDGLYDTLLLLGLVWLSYVPLMPTRRAPDRCRHDPGIGDHAYPTSLQAGLRPTSHCPCPFSPRNVRLGCLSL
jgi:hypothetical protein